MLSLDVLGTIRLSLGFGCRCGPRRREGCGKSYTLRVAGQVSPGVRRRSERVGELVREILRRRVAADGCDFGGGYVRLLEQPAGAFATLADDLLLDACAQLAPEGVVHSSVRIAEVLDHVVRRDARAEVAPYVH